MDKIKVICLNPEAAEYNKKLMVAAARLTQRAESLGSTDDFIQLFNKPVTDNTYFTMCSLPHNNIRCFGTITLCVVGASRRFLAQITRRKVGVTFSSGSLQYSNYTDKAQFVVPYSIKELGKEKQYLATCSNAMRSYKDSIEFGGVDNDAAGYMAPQGLRNVLIIDASPQAWLEMLRQRLCRRNTAETRYVMMLCWKVLYALDSTFYSADFVLPPCYSLTCPEGKMSCGKVIKQITTPDDFIATDFPLIGGDVDGMAR